MPSSEIRLSAVCAVGGRPANEDVRIREPAVKLPSTKIPKNGDHANVTFEEFWAPIGRLCHTFPSVLY
jgi:hypothetical protein